MDGVAAHSQVNGNAAGGEKSTLKVIRRTNRSKPMFLLQHSIKPINSQLIKPRTEQPAGSPRLHPHGKATKHCDVHERIVEEMYIYDLAPKQQSGYKNGHVNGITKKQKRRRLYYFSGGGWHSAATSEHWVMVAELAVQLPSIDVSLVSYPLVPHSPAPIAFPHIMKTFKKLLQEADEAGEEVILAGDSAGGNIILCITLELLRQDENATCPVALMAISPSTDLRRCNPEIPIVEKHDPILRVPFIQSTARRWRGDWDASDPRVSPLLAEVTPFAQRNIKVNGLFGRYDVLYPDALLFRNKLAEAGVSGEWLDWDKQMHVFPLAWSFGLPESVEAKEWMVDVLGRT